MEKTYNAPRRYKQLQDSVRDYGALLQQIRDPPSDGKLWLLVLPRRGGKTWTLKALQQLLGTSARYLELRDLRPGEEWWKEKSVTHWLLDELLGSLEQTNGVSRRSAAPAEPTEYIEQARHLLERCAALHKEGTSVVLALTPRELRLLQKADLYDGRVSHKSILRLGPLTQNEARKMARTPPAEALIASLPPIWRRTPFFLELIFELDEQARTEGQPHDQESLISAVLEACASGKHQYLEKVFGEGLDEDDRNMLRAIARGAQIAQRDCEPLLYAGLVAETPSSRRKYIADPVLAAHLCPVRIHHLSDIHVGPKAARSTDIKDKGRVAEEVDSGTVYESYLTHLEGLAPEAAPHLVVISGDLTEWATEKELKKARRWVDQITPLLAPHVLIHDHMPRVLLVGGNHDVAWDRARGLDSRARHRRFAKHFAAYPHPHLEISPEQRASLSTVLFQDLGIEFLLLGSSEIGGHVDEAFEAFRRFQELLTLPEGAGARKRSQAQRKATRDARIDPGIVHSRDLKRIRGRKWNQPVTIAVIHHPVSPFPTTEVNRYAGLLNAGEVKQALMEKSFCLVLCGHVHAGFFAEEHWPGRHDWKLRIAAAPSLGSSEVLENNGFNVIDVWRDVKIGSDTRVIDKTHRVQVRRFVRRSNTWSELANEKIEPFEPGT